MAIDYEIFFRCLILIKFLHKIEALSDGAKSRAAYAKYNPASRPNLTAIVARRAKQ